MRRVLVLVLACVATAALAATPALGGTSTNLTQVPADVYYKDGDCDSLPTIDVESQVGVAYWLNGVELPKTKFTVPYGSSGVVIAVAQPGYEIVGPTQFPFGFTFDQETCGGTGGSTTGGGTTGGETTGGETTGSATTGSATTGGGTTGGGGVSGSGTGGTGGTGGTTGGVAGAQTGGQLPFTGLPVWVPLLAGAALVSGGALLFRRRRDELS